MQRSDFMRMINESFPTGGLTCSFQDHQLSEFIQIKRRTVTYLPEKRVVSVVGPQNDNLWVLGPDIHINSQGQSVSPEESSYIWISDMYSGPGVAAKSSACTIQLPLGTQPLLMLMDLLRETMKHNFFPAVLTIGATCIALHYKTVMEKFEFCPVPLVFGSPGTGKTTAAKCGLAMIGVLTQRFWSHGTKEMYSQLCSDGFLPLLIDDPRSQNAISGLVMSLYNGAYEGTISRGGNKPSCMAIITANFTVIESEKYIIYIYSNYLYTCALYRYLSRCLLIEFKHPRMKCPVTNFDKLHHLMNQSSSAIGFLISLGQRFTKECAECLDNIILPKLDEVLGENVQPRVRMGYGMLLWFVKQVILL